MTKIITDLDLLAKPAEPLKFLTDNGTETEAGQKIINQLKEVLTSDESLIALAAPQIGIDARIFCIRFNNIIKTFINPIITKKKGINIVLENCSSMPGKEIVIGRPEEITVVYYNEDFKYEENKLLGAAAGLFDQQAQLLDGILPDSLGMVSDIKEDGAITEEDLPVVAQYYKETFLPTKLALFKQAVDTDEVSQKAYKNLKFTEEVINGRITVVESEEETQHHLDIHKQAKQLAAKSMLNLKKQQKADYHSYINNITKRK